MYSCISFNSFEISCESFEILHNSSWLKSGVICLHKRIWLMTFPKFEGPALLSEIERLFKEEKWSGPIYRSIRTYPWEWFELVGGTWWVHEGIIATWRREERGAGCRLEFPRRRRCKNHSKRQIPTLIIIHMAREDNRKLDNGKWFSRHLKTQKAYTWSVHTIVKTTALQNLISKVCQQWLSRQESGFVPRARNTKTPLQHFHSNNLNQQKSVNPHQIKAKFVEGLILPRTKRYWR